MIPDDRRYSKEHEWVKPEEGSDALVGITHFAQDQLGDVVYLDLPGAGDRVEQFAKLGEIESVKAVSDLFSPVTGEVVGVNQEAIDHPELVNEDPSGKGWLLRVRMQDPAEMESLLTAEEYSAFLEEASH
jgi:glycine cleavage system H protein